jgi:hypothetical protein
MIITRIVGIIALLLASVAHAEVTSFAVKPSLTDPAIKTFDEPHWGYINREIIVDHKKELPAARGQLLLWLTGTGGTGRGPAGFANLAADLGYHVVSVMYPDDIPATACAGDSDPKSFENFRMAIIQGGHAKYQDGRKELNIAPADSIENRLAKLLAHLQKIRPRENWAQFLNTDGSPKWETIAIAGQSQGGGHAALIGIKHKVARVICFGAPKDFSRKLKAPAAWYSLPSATPKDRFFAFNHHQDPKGCTTEELVMNQKALGLTAFGPIAEVDHEPPPYHHAHMLYTSYPAVTITAVESDASKTAHTAAINTKNAERWKEVWTYLLTQASRNVGE